MGLATRKEIAEAAEAKTAQQLETIARKKSARDTKAMGNHMSEEEIDKTLKDSFPASDPPGNY